jgi:hypothetical protein
VQIMNKSRQKIVRAQLSGTKNGGSFTFLMLVMDRYGVSANAFSDYKER